MRVTKKKNMQTMMRRTMSFFCLCNSWLWLYRWNSFEWLLVIDIMLWLLIYNYLLKYYIIDYYYHHIKYMNSEKKLNFKTYMFQSRKKKKPPDPIFTNYLFSNLPWKFEDCKSSWMFVSVGVRQINGKYR